MSQGNAQLSMPDITVKTLGGEWSFLVEVSEGKTKPIESLDNIAVKRNEKLSATLRNLERVGLGRLYNIYKDTRDGIDKELAGILEKTPEKDVVLENVSECNGADPFYRMLNRLPCFIEIPDVASAESRRPSGFICNVCGEPVLESASLKEEKTKYKKMQRRKLLDCVLRDGEEEAKEGGKQCCMCRAFQ